MLKEPNGDFTYNGIPIYKVGFGDFSYVVNCFENGNRIFSKVIKHPELNESYKKIRNKAFGIWYEGVIIDFRDLKQN